jgi:uncharacterized protein
MNKELTTYNNKQPLINKGWLRVLLFSIFYFLLVDAVALLFQLATGKPTEADSRLVYFSVAITAIISFVAVWLFRKIIDRQTLASLGFDTAKKGDHAIVGFFLGILLLCTGSLVLYASGYLQWTGIDFNAQDLFTGLVLMMIVALYEEVVFRGYILNNLLQSLNKWPALLITSVLFAIAHLNNPGITVLAVVNVFAAGLLLGVNYLYTRNLWFAIMFHLSWNFFQGPVLGFQVSGAGTKSILTPELKGATSITGGPFGLEGSVVALILYILAIAAFIWVYERQYTAKKIAA